jgi:hypothetical protein
MYVQEVKDRKAERLHVRISPELKKRFEEKVWKINQFLRKEDKQDLSSWLNRFIVQFVANCDRFGSKLSEKGIAEEKIMKDYRHILPLEQLLLFYDDFYQYSNNHPLENELVSVISRLDGDQTELASFWKLVEDVKRRKGVDGKD